MKIHKINEISKIYKAKSNGQTLYQHNQEMLKILIQLKDILNMPHKEYLQLRKTIFKHDIGKITNDFQSNIESRHRKCRHEILSASLNSLTETQRLAILTHHKSLSDLYNLLIADFQVKSYEEELQDMNNKLQNGGYVYIKQKILQYMRNEDFIKCKNNITHKGILNLCDHLASAGIKKISVGMDTDKQFKFDEYNSMQHTCKSIKEDCMLIGSTGIGKTEAAFYWSNSMQNKNKSRRVYYILPFTASINAMYKRLKAKGIDVGMLHSKAEYFLSKEIDENVKSEYQTYRKLIKQVTVCTIFQLVKAFFNCKFNEMLLAMFENSIFIIDEIHSFDIKTLVYILETLKYLKEHYNISICIMSASIPQPLITLIQEKLNISKIITPNIEENNIKRHKIHVKDYYIQNNFENIKKQLLTSNKKILICLNTVSEAISTYEYFNQFCKNNNIKIKLIHGRFNAKSRESIEKEIGNARLLIGTQAIEVSLDINFDELHTQIAPIDALIQRMGRINRKRLVVDIKNIFVYDCDYQKIKFYDPNLLQKTKQVLNTIGIVDENNVQEYIDEVYENIDIEEYNKYAKIYNISVIQECKAASWDLNYSDKMLEGGNYSVICCNLEEEYNQLINDRRYLEANSLFVNLSKGQYKRLKGMELLNDKDVCLIEYNEDIGLRLPEYSEKR